MGIRTELEIENRQRQARISIPEPAVQDRWRKLQECCFETIKVAELEVSGIRDGDGCWHGSDVVFGILRNPDGTITRLREAIRESYPTNDEFYQVHPLGETTKQKETST